MKYHTLFFRKLRKMLQNVSSAAVVIDALRVNKDIKLTLNAPTKMFVRHTGMNQMIRLWYTVLGVTCA